RDDIPFGALGLDLFRETPPTEVVPEAAHGRQLAAHELELRLQHVRGRARIENAPVEIRQLATAPLVELDQLAAPFSVHLLLLKLLGKPLDLRCAIAPQSA